MQQIQHIANSAAGSGKDKFCVFFDESRGIDCDVSDFLLSISVIAKFLSQLLTKAVRFELIFPLVFHSFLFDELLITAFFFSIFRK